MNGNVCAERAAAGIFGEYELWSAEFAEITRRAKRRFETRDWQGTQADAADRLALYRLHVEVVVVYLSELHGAELAETFFNSVSRRVLGTVGAAPDTEFLKFPASGPVERTGPLVFDTYRGEGTSRGLIERLLRACGWEVPYTSAGRDAELVARVVDTRLQRLGWRGGPLAIDVLRAPFYRNKGAYLVGRIHGADEMIPLVLPLIH